MKPPKLPEPVRKHYHWVIAAVVFLIFFVAQGLGNNLSSLYLLPITKDLGISRSIFSLTKSLQYVVLFISDLGFAWGCRKFGMRKIITFSLLLTALGYVIMGSAQSAAPLFLSSALMGAVTPYWSTSGVSRIITTWFHRHRGLVLGIVMAASGLGASLFALGITEVMVLSSWRVALWSSAALLILIGLVSLLFIRSTPEEVGLSPLGEGEEIKPISVRRPREDTWQGFGLQYLKRRPSFYLMLLGFALFTCLNTGVLSILVVHLQDRGFSPMEAASVHSLLFLVLAFVKVAEGELCDHVSPRLVLVAAVSCGIAGTVLLALCRSMPMALVSALLLSIGASHSTVIQPMLITDLFGHRDFDLLLGATMAMFDVSGIVVPPLINGVFDLTGSYHLAFPILLAMMVLALICDLAACRCAAGDRRRTASGPM